MPRSTDETLETKRLSPHSHGAAKDTNSLIDQPRRGGHTIDIRPVSCFSEREAVFYHQDSAEADVYSVTDRLGFRAALRRHEIKLGAKRGSRKTAFCGPRRCGSNNGRDRRGHCQRQSCDVLGKPRSLSKRPCEEVVYILGAS